MAGGRRGTSWLIPMCLVIVIASLDRMGKRPPPAPVRPPVAPDSTRSLATPPPLVGNAAGRRTVQCDVSRWAPRDGTAFLQTDSCEPTKACPTAQVPIERGVVHAAVAQATRGGVLGIPHGATLALRWDAASSDCTWALDAAQGTAVHVHVADAPPDLLTRVRGCAAPPTEVDPRGDVHLAIEDAPCDLRVDLVDDVSGLMATTGPIRIQPRRGEEISLAVPAPDPATLAPWSERDLLRLEARVRDLERRTRRGDAAEWSRVVAMEARLMTARAKRATWDTER